MKKFFIFCLLIFIVAAAFVLIMLRERNMKKERVWEDKNFSEIWDNRLLSDVQKYQSLEPKERYLVLLASNVALQAKEMYKKLLKEALLNNVLSPNEVKEVLYQSMPYAGGAKVYDFLYITNNVFSELNLKDDAYQNITTNQENRLQEGLKVQKKIFGEQIDSMRKNAPTEQKHIQDLLSANCFGDYYTRNGLSLQHRELITFAVLISLGGVDPQVKAHIQGNVTVGNDKKKLLDVITVLLPYIGYPRALNALNSLNVN